MRNLKVMLKMVSGFGLIVIMTVVLATIGIVSFRQIDESTNEMVLIHDASSSANDVAAAHYQWYINLSNAVFMKTEFTGSLDSTACSLGKWKKSEYVLTTTDTNILNKIAQLDEPHDYIHKRAGDIVNFIKAGDYESAAEIFQNEIAPNVTKTISLLTEITDLYKTNSDKITEQGNAIESSATLIFIIFTFLVVIFSVILGFVIARGINRPLNRIKDIVVRVGETGDYNFTEETLKNLEYDATARDEIGQCALAFKHLLAHLTTVGNDLNYVASKNLDFEVSLASSTDVMGNALNTMISNLNETFVEITNISHEVAVSAGDIAGNSMQLAQAATEQTEAVSSLTRQIGEVAVKTGENTSMAENAAQFGNTIKQNAEKGSIQMQQMMDAVKEINDASASIGKVIKVIDDIAFQTNILALNAAVEAARAGEHGKGFAVVADEVRSLAAKSAEAAKETGSLIDNSITKAELGARIASETNTSLEEIVQGIMESSKILNVIATSSQEQTTAIKQIESGVGQVGEVVGLISKGAEVAANASNVMHTQSDALADFISHYKLHNHKAVKNSSLSKEQNINSFGTYNSKNDKY